MSTIESTMAAINSDTSSVISSNNTVTGTASASLTSTEFLNLILQQLQFQDPMEPQDNSEFVSQTCQLSQLESTQSQTATSSEQQAASLVGSNVTLTNPKDTNSTITGTVTSALIDGEDSAITVNNVSYPLKYLQYVNQVSTASAETTTGSN